MSPIKDLLHDLEQASLTNAISDLKRRNEAIHHGKIIAEMSFGFWSSLLYHKSDAPSFKKDKNKAVFWPYCIKDAFPYMPKKIRTRIYAERKIECIRRFRNRIFHHEPIWKMNLDMKYKDILEVISWFYEEYEKFIIIDKVKETILK